MSHPIYILGPCSAETREQVLETAGALHAVLQQFIFRAGAWKPRTRPDTFQGAGEEGLRWLQEVKQQFGMEIATEVATPEHVEAALKAGVDYLWIGARSSANPIVVQEIAEAINAAKEQCSVPKALLIKNPVNADAELWLGNIARLEQTGITVMAVHRGCGHQPCWAMAHAIRTARPDIPMLLDPSHMSGDAAKVPELLNKIEELGLDGAMIEVHCNPAAALSDKAQQVTPEELNAALRQLNAADGCSVNTPKEQCIAAVPQLNWLRAEIDELDERLWDTIAARMEVSKRIGAWKKAHGVAPLQPERYKEIIERIQNTDRFADRIQTDFAVRLYNLIHEESLRQQE